MSQSTAEDWSDETEPLPVGTLIGGRFEVVGIRGRGGMGSVYEARDRTIGRPVALKLLEVPSAKAAERFALEAHAASRMSSRHAAAIYDFGEDPEQGHYMVMELLTGNSLDEVLADRGWLEPQEAASVGADIAEALAAAHDAGIVHRDLKPGNVMVLEEGGVKVVDFGIARITESRGWARSPNSLTNPNAIVGTPAYISPEAVSGDEVGPAADLYALGVLLFEMVTGETPFWDDIPSVLCTMHVKEEPPTMESIRAGIELPDGYRSLVMALLEKDPEVRPRSAREVASTLRAMSGMTGPVHLSAPPRVAGGAATARVLKTPAPRARGLLLAIVAIGVVVSAAAVGTIVALLTRAPPEPMATTELEATTEPEATTELEITAGPRPTAPAEPAAPREIEVAVSTTPAGATLTLDGEPVESPFTLPRDDAEHELEISAPRHRPETRTIRADRDLSLEVVLRRARRQGRGGASQELPAAMREW